MVVKTFLPGVIIIEFVVDLNRKLNISVECLGLFYPKKLFLNLVLQTVFLKGCKDIIAPSGV